MSADRPGVPLGIKLKGPAVDAGTIEACELAQILTASAVLIKELGNVEGFRQLPKPSLKVAATSKGSFDLSLLLEGAREAWGMMQGALLSEEVQAIGTLSGLATTFVEVIRYFRNKGKKREAERKVDEQGQVKITLVDGTVLEVSPHIATAVDFPRVMLAARQIVSSATSPGVEAIAISTRTHGELHNAPMDNVVEVTAEEARDFPDPAGEASAARIEQYEAWATFDRPDFIRDKWGVTTTRGRWKMTIADESFLARVREGLVSLNKYSEFRITWVEEPYITPAGQTRFHRTVTKVEERDNAQRTSTFFDETEQGEP